MALVRNIKPKKGTQQRVHGVHRETICQYLRFNDDANNHYIQLNTFSSHGHKVTQEMQFNETAAAQLKILIEITWPNLK